MLKIFSFCFLFKCFFSHSSLAKIASLLSSSGFSCNNCQSATSEKFPDTAFHERKTLSAHVCNLSVFLLVGLRLDTTSSSTDTSAKCFWTLLPFKDKETLLFLGSFCWNCFSSLSSIFILLFKCMQLHICQKMGESPTQLKMAEFLRNKWVENTWKYTI